MGINFKDWHNRIASRSDLTGRLTHLTRPLATEKTSGKSFEEINLMAIDTLIKILSEKKLVGSSKDGYVVGDNAAVCFQDAPLYAIVQNVEHERTRRASRPGERLRYCGVGLSFENQIYIIIMVQDL
ncbi:hypothetical protein [Paenibacillus sp. FSL L8-0506]|uniref:hypothetical protein n=1 Tax=Paenibacillus sp. FSL L8-0506 TaxID=2975335 RepID=UPI0030F80E50